jgi:hypothetical protein
MDFQPRGSGTVVALQIVACEVFLISSSSMCFEMSVLFGCQSEGIVTRRPLVLQLHRIDGDREYAVSRYHEDRVPRVQDLS